ncbi:MAG: twin-arginine translocation signal domain-containing protein, partial [Actinomycetota bacterium]
MTREPISRRRFLRGTATAAGAAAALRIGPASALGRNSVPRMRLRMRNVGVASGSALRPSLLAFAGLAGFDELLEKAGARTAFRWTDLPPAPGEATAVISGFVPERVSRSGSDLVVTGTPDRSAIRIVSVDLPTTPRMRRPIVAIRHT